MRGSQFQTASALESIRQNQHYIKHKEVVSDIKHKERFLSPSNLFKLEKESNYHFNLLAQIRESRNTHANNQINQENIRFLVKLIEIKKGHKVNVAKHDDWKKRLATNSPLNQSRGHKNFVAENAQILSDNQRLLKILTSVKSTKSINSQNLSDEGNKQKEFVNMILKSKLRNASMLTSGCDTGSIQLKLSEKRMNQSEISRPYTFRTFDRRTSLPVTSAAENFAVSQSQAELEQMPAIYTLPNSKQQDAIGDEIKKEAENNQQDEKYQELNSDPSIQRLEMTTTVVKSVDSSGKKKSKKSLSPLKTDQKVYLKRKESMTKVYNNKIQPGMRQDLLKLQLVSPMAIDVFDEMKESQRERLLKHIQKIEDNTRLFEIQEQNNKVILPPLKGTLQFKPHFTKKRNSDLVAEFFTMQHGSNNKIGKFFHYQHKVQLPDVTSKNLTAFEDTLTDEQGDALAAQRTHQSDDMVIQH